MDKNDVTHSEANTSDLERYINQKFDEIIIANTEKKVCKSHQLHKSDKYCQTSNEDSFELKYLELENTRMATEIKFLMDQILEKTLSLEVCSCQNQQTVTTIISRET